MNAYDRNNLIVINASVLVGLIDVIGMVGSVVIGFTEHYAWMWGFWTVCAVMTCAALAVFAYMRREDPPKT